MDDTTSILFGLDDHRVLDVERVGDRVVRVVIEILDREGACPGCGSYRHRGTLEQPVWVHRRMLLTAGNRLSPRQLARLRAVLARDDPTGEIGAPWAVKERLRMLLARGSPTGSAMGCGGFTTPRRPPICPRRPAWPRRSRPGGRRSWWRSPRSSPTPAPTASTESSSRRSGSPAASATWTTTSAASCPTSRSPERDQRQQHERGRRAQLRRARKQAAAERAWTCAEVQHLDAPSVFSQFVHSGTFAPVTSEGRLR